MSSPRERYNTDAHYRQLVDVLVHQMVQCKLTPAEIREAAILASIIYNERYALTKFGLFPDLGLQISLEQFEDFYDTGLQRE